MVSAECAARFICQFYLKLGNVEISAVADINKNRLKSVGEKFLIAKQFSDYRELLATQDVDAVIIATPTNTHSEIAIESLKAKNIY